MIRRWLKGLSFFANFSNCSPSLRWVRDFLVSHDLSLPSHGCGCCRSQLCLVFASCSPLVQLFDFPWSQLVKDRHTELPLAATPDWWSRVFSFPHPFRFEMRIYNLAMIKNSCQKLCQNNVSGWGSFEESIFRSALHTVCHYFRWQLCMVFHPWSWLASRKAQEEEMQSQPLGSALVGSVSSWNHRKIRT